jgi:hypothetical protein
MCCQGPTTCLVKCAPNTASIVHTSPVPRALTTQDARKTSMAGSSAGVMASPAGQWLGAETDRAGRVKVGPGLATFRRKIPFFRLAVNRAAQSKARRGVTGGLKIV